MLRRIMIFLTSILLLLNSALVNASIGGWTLSNPTAVGASILYDGTKGSATSSILISPNASQVAKVLRGGIAGYALTFAVEQLLGAVDWVLDPANNRIRYREVADPFKCGVNGKDCPQDLFLFKSSAFLNVSIAFKWDRAYAEIICKAYIPTNNTSQKFLKLENFDAWDPNGFTCVYDGSGTIRTSWEKISNSFYNPEEKYLSLITAAQQVIENAESDNLDAQFAVLAAATNILSEAEQDDTKAKPIEDELERNSKKCPNGESRNIYGQCWICPNEDKQAIENNKNIAKVRAQALGSCLTGGRNKVFKNFDKDEFLVRSTAWDALAEAREIENMCWLPPHANHVQEAQMNRQIAETCRAGAAQAIK